MREILFRGAQKVDGSKSLYWYEGSLVSEKNCYTGEVKYYIENENGSFLVIPKTVGQYTGLTDKNGKKIFEGDIVKTDKFSEPNKQYIIKYDLQFGAFIGCDRYNLYFVTFDGDSDEFEVIGNIHDSPELLKEAQQE